MVQLEDGQIEIDYSLVKPGVIANEEYVAIVMDGTFHPSHIIHENDHERHFKDIPLHRPDGKLV